MQYYFSLQFTRLKRWFSEAGVSYILGICIMVILFVVLSKVLFFKSVLAKWIYPILALSIIIKLGSRERNTRLKLIYNKTIRLYIRILENGIIAIPFIFYLLYEQQFLIAIGFILVSISLALVSSDVNLNRVVPTPFGKFPFENIIGFRKSFLIIALVYFLIFKAIQVDNYNLAVVSYGMILLIFMSFYFKPEQRYFVWIFADKPQSFLRRKLSDSIICASLVSIPGLISLLLFFPERLIISIVVFLLGLIFIVSMVFAKYAAYPHEMNLPQGILFALSLWFPPMLLIIIPLFYKKSKKNLNLILE